MCGWGEVSPLRETVGFDPSADDVWRELIDVTMPRFVDLVEREGRAPEWSRIAHLAAPRSTSAWSWALLEMALLDQYLRQERQSLCDVWGVRAESVPTITTTSLIDASAPWQPPTRAARVRVKINGDTDLNVALPTLAGWQVPILLDYNGAARDVAAVVRQLAPVFEGVDVAAIEQPFPPGDFIRPAELSALVPVRVSMDEGVRNIADLRQISRYRSASLVCIKPPRVGGLAWSRSMLAQAASLGLAAYVGGFFESPLARRAHALVAATFDVEPSDVAAVATQAPEGVEEEWGIGRRPAPAVAGAPTATWTVAI